MAAGTTSLPETPGGERNWDYRSTWIRDSTFTLQALRFLNLDWEADEFMHLVADLEINERRRAADHVWVWARALEDAVARLGGTPVIREFVDASALAELSPENL